MDTQAYPGKGLSLSQLVFALSEELKRTAYSPSFTLDEASELDQDVSAAIREWRNSLVPINRLPLDVLSLISTHLPCMTDRFNATFVCRHWRRILLRNAILWSDLHLSLGEACVKALLERARGSPLRVHARHMDPTDAVMLLPPHTKQITCLCFELNDWVDIQRFSEITSGHLPLLHTLHISAIPEIDLDDPGVTASPLHPLFRDATGLQKFSLDLEVSPLLNLFIFPNLTSFELSVFTPTGEFCGSQLLDFLEASPMLKNVHTKIDLPISFEGIPQERTVVLHNVERLCLAVSDAEAGCRLATHISCPSVNHTSFTHMSEPGSIIGMEVFPSLNSLDAIIRQYTRSPIEEITFKIKWNSDYLIACFLTFRSVDTSVIELRFEIANNNENPYATGLDPWLYFHVFSDAAETIQGLPLLANVKRLRMSGHPALDEASDMFTDIGYELGQVLQSLGPLEELIINYCDTRPYLEPFHSPRLRRHREPVQYPPIKVLKIKHSIYGYTKNLTEGLVALAKVQHELGRPFKRVSVRMYEPPAEMEEGLRPWVGAVDCRHAR